MDCPKTDVTVTEYGPTKDVDVQPKWSLPKKIAIKTTITGAFFSKRQNPHHPLTIEEILRSAREAFDAGSPPFIYMRGRPEYLPPI